MPFEIKIEYEGHADMQRIAKEFEGKLSEKEILKTAAFAVNITARRILGMIKKEVKKDYTITNKHLDRAAKLTKPASGNRSGLYATISYSPKTIPMSGFKFSDLNKGGQFFSYNIPMNGVRIEIKKGKQEILRHAFVKSMKSGHLGIWGHGSYVSGKFVPKDMLTGGGKPKITEMKTASPFTMYTNPKMDNRIYDYVGTNMPNRFKALLQQKVNKMN